MEPHWLTEEEATDSLTPLQLDVFHALREAYHGAEHRPQPALTPTRRAKQDAEKRENALKKFSVGTVVWTTFTDDRGGGNGTVQ